MEKQKNVTSYDVAKAAGVSQSAVSRVFRPGLSVSKKTREKVIATANKMGYRPNAIARMLITKQSGMVAVIISSLANVTYPEVLSQLN
ncbi:MAG: LacI family DNA-binding transcriptional regulator, partial [Kangiellaceae bacterium]